MGDGNGNNKAVVGMLGTVLQLAASMQSPRFNQYN
jgi:hypothetical protein